MSDDLAAAGYRVVKGGGLSFLANDPVVIRAVERCAELDRENQSLRREIEHLQHELTARYRTLRRDVNQIKRRVCR